MDVDQQVWASLVRVTHTGVCGFGKIASIQQIIKTHPGTGELQFIISNAIKIDSIGNIFNLISGVDSIAIRDSVPNGIYNSSYKENNISIFPNPATNKITVYCNDKQNLNFQVFNMLGESLLQENLVGRTNNIDIANLPKGVYIIKVSDADWSVQKKLIKN